MSVLSTYFDKSVNQCSPVQVDTARVLKYDENGREVVTRKEIDYPSIQASHGSEKDWSLANLLKAGINPNFSIHTGNNTRLEGLAAIDFFAAQADSIIESEKSKE